MQTGGDWNRNTGPRYTLSHNKETHCVLEVLLLSVFLFIYGQSGYSCLTIYSLYAKLG